MRFFPIVDVQYVILLVFLGLTALVVVYVSFRGYGRSPDEAKGKEELEEYPEGIRAGRGPIPPVLILLYVGCLIWALAYAISVGLRGGPF